VVTHGNGPQVGRILLQQEAAKRWVHPMPLDVCGAESQGLIGYLLQVTIGDVFFERGMERPVATVLTLTRVRPDDPAFANPTKPIGPFYEEVEARQLEADRGWVLMPDPHGGFRRVVPSPDPYSIVEAPVIRTLVADGTIVIASGGGGIPVVEDGPRLIGREGVVDKDLAAAILARDVEASTLLILTDVQAVQAGVRDRARRADRADDRRGCARAPRGGGVRCRLDGPEGRGCGSVRRAGRRTLGDRGPRLGGRGPVRGVRDEHRLRVGSVRMRVRVVVYNVRGFRDGSERVLRLVGHFRPDVLLLNETGGRWRLRRFAKALGMDLAADPWSPFRRRVKDAVLVRPPWRIVGHRQHRFEGGPWLYPRGALVAELEAR
jgi:hypothetical protein